MSDERGGAGEMPVDVLRLLVHDDLPPAVVERAAALFTWRDIDAELAELADVGHELVSVRGDDPITLSFECDEWTIDCEWLDGSLVGQIVPRLAGAVRPMTPSGALTDAEVDAGGVFRIAHVPRGPLSLRLIDEHRDEIARTTWVTL
jgi:hypothetical protein